MLTVSWIAGNGQHIRKEFEDFRGNWNVGSRLDVLFDPSHPATDAVLAIPHWTFAVDFRADAVFQAVVPITLAGVVLAFGVFWPAGPWLFGAKARRARRSLRGYVVVPAVVCVLVVAGAVAIQDQPLSAYSLGADKIVGWLSVVLMLLLIWPYVRAVQYYRLRQLLTVPDDAVESAVVNSVVGRRLQIGSLQMVALAGQRPRKFRSAERVRIYGRWERRGPALITDNEKLLIGFAKRLAPAPIVAAAPDDPTDVPGAPADISAEPLSRKYPQLARKPRRYLVRALTLLVVAVGGSIAILAIAGRAAIGPLWLTWLLCVLLIGIPIWRYRQLSRLLLGQHVARNGVVTSLTRSSLGAVVPSIAVSAERTVRLRLLGERQASWLAEGRAVVLLQVPTLSIDAVLLTTEDGHAALAIATVVQVQRAVAP